MRRNKKGDLSLSINAIVILILAITMLGLGLAFMRNIFGSATKEFQEVGGTVKKQMIDQMKESEKVVDISNPKINLKSGEKKQVFIGFKNEDTGTTTRKFQIREVEASRLGDADIETNKFKVATTSTYDVTLDGATTGICGARTKLGEEPADTEVYIEFKNTPTEVKGGDVVVVPMNIISVANPTKKSTCIYEIKVDTAAPSSAAPYYDKVIELTIDLVI